MEVEPKVKASNANGMAANAEPAKNESNQPAQGDTPLQTAYAPAGSTTSRAASASEDPSYYCIRCGTNVPQTEEVCPSCGYPIQELLDEKPRRRPRFRELQPIPGFLPIVGAILIPLGLVFFAGGPIISNGFHRPGSLPFVIGLFFVGLAALTELTALVLLMIWLYQAWRVVLRGDEDFSPGLMVGLLFVPFFNFYWMFRAIPGLSAAIQEELRYLAPARAHSAGWVPGLIACIFALIPYGQPVAVCMFLAWMLIANNAVHRLVRYHDELRRESRRDAALDAADT
jgi:DNA-directed RNA polymerase subunit RPC12/RpoP